jgi:hypothetical protein
MKYTKKQIKKAFISWLSEERLKPSDFISVEELDKTDVKDAAELNTNTLINYIKEQ